MYLVEKLACRQGISKPAWQISLLQSEKLSQWSPLCALFTCSLKRNPQRPPLTKPVRVDGQLDCFLLLLDWTESIRLIAR